MHSRSTLVRPTQGGDQPHRFPFDGPGFAYISDPGVVNNSPVSRYVFRPERIIGQPPYSSSFAPSRSSSCVTVRRHESPTGSISQVILELPSLFTSSLQRATMLWTSRRGGSTSRFSPSPREKLPSEERISKRDPGVQSEMT